MDATDQVAKPSREVIVHEFQITSGHCAARQPQMHGGGASSLLQAGFTLVSEAVGEVSWKNTCLTDYKFTLNPSACFVWAQNPPQLSENLVERCSQLKPWGEKAADEEIVRRDDLTEFQHAVQSNKSIQTNTAEKRRFEADNSADALPSKMKRRLFTGPLHGVVPQPLFYSSTFNTTTRGQKVQVSPYTKYQSIAIPPYSENISQPCHPLSSYARTAWIIPIRGILPWDTCTPAVILEDGEDSVGKEGNWIQWTKTALQSFWTFLLDVRGAGKLGQVGISFHVATSREREASLSADAISEQYSGSGLGQRRNEVQVWNMPLSCADYVKVYHEANNAMALRNVLDAWAYVSPGGRKVRVLKGSKLALVDERSNGIVVS